MTASLISSLALYAFITSITPGPNNLMLASSGLTFGFQRTLPHMLGISFGCVTLIVASGLGLGALFHAAPWLQTALKIAGAAYLLYLAWKLWRAGEMKEIEGADPIGFWGAAAFQFVNPKALVMAVTAVSAFAPQGPDYARNLALVGCVFTAVNLPCIASWALFGAGMRTLLRDRTALIWFNRAMAILTALTALLIVR
ncbi:MAG: LysE family translocator [Alphaproteobacteria bacterium]|nr:LysE family translocator [Alphaproteobacteria bacterium]